MRGGEFMEVDMGILEVGLGVETEFGLAEVGGGGGEVDGDVVGGGDEAGEVEELVEMAMAWEWHYYNLDLSFFGAGIHALAWILDITNIHGGGCFPLIGCKMLQIEQAFNLTFSF
ncbi:hypothetical protein Vadar_008597 [Vaccinium darrowii]|uniref:Uncharacterized protein n=1 Tax=Vaccinium darrowii TaxID=229202 RepID=A0ACB7XPC1_9ERIC|nr:hypothetical protein Vadar_008597 [Vaccinium darrowii]